METLNQYFTYYDENLDLREVFNNLSQQLKVIHEHNMYVPNMTGDSISYDDELFSYNDMESSDNIAYDQRRNNVTLAKLILGAYLSLQCGYKDFSNVSDEWFIKNVSSICSSITDDNFDGDYFSSLFSEGNNDYYCDYLKRKKQNEALSGRSNIQGYKKVLATAASSLYQEQTFDEGDVDIDKKTASLNVIFYPLLIGSVLLLSVVIMLILKLVN